MPTLFIAGTGTDIGKTYVAAALIRALRANGHAVDALKPVVSGFDPAGPHGSDPAVLLEALETPRSTAALDRISPWRYRAPLSPPLAAEREGLRLDGAAVIALCRERAAAADPAGWLLLESAGGIMSPLDEGRTMLDLAAAVGAPVLLVAGTYLGTISHTLTAAAVVEAAGLTLAGVVLSESQGDHPPVEDTVAALAARLAPAAVTTVGRDQPVSPRALAALLAAAENLV
jgi:dethiobiotin synthetase